MPAGFTLTASPTSPVAGSGNTSFAVRCDALAAATYTGTVSIPNDDADEGPNYTFDITCIVTPAAPEIDVQGSGLSIVSGDTRPV